VSAQIHLVVQDTPDLNDTLIDHPVQQDVSASSATSRDMHCAGADKDFVPRLMTSGLRSATQVGDGVQDYFPVATRLLRTEIRTRPSQNVGKVTPRGLAKANAPLSLGHTLIWKTGDSPLSNLPQIALELLWIIEFNVFASIDRIEADPRSFAQRLEFSRILCFALLYQPQAFADDLARVLVAAISNEVCDEPLLAFGQDDVSRRHRSLRE
jgi:hypothetical protein